MFQLFGEVSSCTFTRTAAGKAGFRANVNPSSKKRTGCDHDARRTKTPSFECLNADDTRLAFIEDESGDCTLYRLEIFLFFEKRPNCAPVKSSIALRTGCPNSRTLAAIEHPELNHGEICRPSHYSTQRVNLSNDSAFGNPADCWIARHLSDGLKGTCDKANSSAQTRRSHRSLGSSVASTDYDDFKFCFKVLR